MRKTFLVAVLAALALTATAGACAGPNPTEARRPAVRLDDDPPPSDTTHHKCGGMIGSGTYVC